MDTSQRATGAHAQTLPQYCHGYFTEGYRCACANFTTMLIWILHSVWQVRMRKLYHNIGMDTSQRAIVTHAQTLPQYCPSQRATGANFTTILIWILHRGRHVRMRNFCNIFYTSWKSDKKACANFTTIHKWILRRATGAHAQTCPHL